MILVLLGTQNNSFHRLLEEIDRLNKEIEDTMLKQIIKLIKEKKIFYNTKEV